MKILIILSLLISSGFSAESEALRKKKIDIFKANWESEVLSSRHCGLNSEHLIKLWSDAGVNLSNSKVWHITNKGYGYFGLVKYYQNRWQSLGPSKLNPEYLTNGSGGWYFHAFVVSDGMVYDYSYRKGPTVVSLKDYVFDMFVLKEDIGTLSWERVSDGKKLIKGYQIVEYKGDDIIRVRKEGLPMSSIEKNAGFVAEHVGANILKNLIGYNSKPKLPAGYCNQNFALPNVDIKNPEKIFTNKPAWHKSNREIVEELRRAP